MLTKKQWNYLDIVLLILLPIISVLLSLALQANYLVSTLLFFGLPCVWLSYRTQNRIKKTLIFSLIFSIISVFIADLIAIVNGAWITYSMFDYQVLGLIPLEDFLFGFLFVYAVVMFYEHFLDKGKKEVIEPRFKYFILGGIIMITIIFALLFRGPSLLNIQYSYVWLGTLFGLVPLVIFLAFFPKYISRYIKPAVYFFFLTLIFEITAFSGCLISILPSASGVFVTNVTN
jgi:hypothetical protein